MDSKDFTDYLQNLVDSGVWESLIRGPGAPAGVIHTAEHNAKIGESVKRWRLEHPEEDLERNRKISEASRGRIVDDTTRQTLSEGQKRRWSRGDEREEYSLRTSRQMIRQWEDPEFRDRTVGAIRESWARKTPKEREEFGEAIRRRYAERSLEEVRLFSEKMSEVVRRVWAGRSLGEVETIGKKISNSVRDMWARMSPMELEAYKEKSSKAHKKMWEDLSPDKRDGWIRNIAVSNSKGPSILELLLGIILERYFPGEWMYNGNGKIRGLIGGRVPDFVRADGQKCLVELHGCVYHHSLIPEDRGSEEETISHYAKCGYKCLVIWGDELFDEEYIIGRVKELMRA